MQPTRKKIHHSITLTLFKELYQAMPQSFFSVVIVPTSGLPRNPLIAQIDPGSKLAVLQTVVKEELSRLHRLVGLDLDEKELNSLIIPHEIVKSINLDTRKEKISFYATFPTSEQAIIFNVKRKNTGYLRNVWVESLDLFCTISIVPSEKSIMECPSAGPASISVQSSSRCHAHPRFSTSGVSCTVGSPNENQGLFQAVLQEIALGRGRLRKVKPVD